jgi:hypothetical protein
VTVATAAEMSAQTSPNALFETSPDAYPITPNDSTDLERPTRWIRATVAGNVAAIMASGNTRTMAFAAGETRRVSATRIKATGTTATGIEAMP